MIDRAALKGTRFPIPAALQAKKVALHNNDGHGINKTVSKTLSILKNINTYIEDMIKNCSMCLRFQQKQSIKKVIPLLMPCNVICIK